MVISAAATGMIASPAHCHGVRVRAGNSGRSMLPASVPKTASVTAAMASPARLPRNPRSMAWNWNWRAM